MKKESVKVTDLELKILQVIWVEGNAPVQTIVDNWQDLEKPGYTTVLKTLQKMEKKGIVGHQPAGKKYHYFSKISRNMVTRNRLGAIIERIFTGDKISFAQYFLESSDLDLNELEKIKQLIEAKENERRAE